MAFRPPDPKSGASASSATLASKPAFDSSLARLERGLGPKPEASSLCLSSVNPHQVAAVRAGKDEAQVRDEGDEPAVGAPLAHRADGS